MTIKLVNTHVSGILKSMKKNPFALNLFIDVFAGFFLTWREEQ